MHNNATLKIANDKPDNLSLTIFDVGGRQISNSVTVKTSQGTNNFDLNSLFDLKNISSGIYSVTIKGENTFVSTKLIIE